MRRIERRFSASFPFYLRSQLCYVRESIIIIIIWNVTLDIVIDIYDKLCGIPVRFIADLVVDDEKKSGMYWTLTSQTRDFI